MATFGEYHSIPGLVAYATLASSQYKIVQACSTAGNVKLGTSSTSNILGVVQNDPAAGEPADVAFLGICKAQAETSVSFGSYLTCSSTGRVKATTSSGDHIIGKALEASSTGGDIIRVLLYGQSKY